MRGPDVIVVGAGQAGLSTSYWLSDLGIDHVVLERGVLGDSWAKRRWDSFTLVTPNWTVRLPGAEYRGPDPDGFMGRDEFVAYLSQWAGGFGCPVQTGIAATGLGQGGNGRLRLDTTDGPMEAAAVVVATGTMQTPRRSPLAGSVAPRIRQLDAETYRNPGDLAPGAVLVVGSGQTGGQIADDLRLAGRRVLLSAGGAARAPRRYRGRDIVAWLDELGFFDRTPDMLESPARRFGAEIQLSGARGGRIIGLHRLRRDGVELLGRLTAADGEKLQFADDLRQNMENADTFSRGLPGERGRPGRARPASMRRCRPPRSSTASRRTATGRCRIAPRSTLRRTKTSPPSYGPPGSPTTSPGSSFPVCDEMGYPVTDRGATSVPGLYFMGLNWMVKRKSGLLCGVGEDARHVAAHIARYLGARS